MQRRDFLRGGLSLAGGIVGASASTGAYGSISPGTRLVTIELRGGLDGLSTFVPIQDDEYYRSRPSTVILGARQLPLSDERGLHPSLAPLRCAWDTGQLAIVEGCGYEDAFRSHFRSYEVWHTGRLRGQASGDGWLGRLRAAAWPNDLASEMMMHVGEGMPYSMVSSTHPGVSFQSPQSLRWLGGPGAETLTVMAQKPAAATGNSASILGGVRRSLQTATGVSERVCAATESYRSRGVYPDHPFGVSMRTVAAVLNSDMPTRLFSVSLGGFDTHGARMGFVYGEQLGVLAQGLMAFLDDLDGTSAAQDTLVLVHSEFGRSLRENDSGGTDHGAAVPMMLLGSRVRGGFHGEHPSLLNPDANGSLIHTTDFRRVYASILSQGFGLEPQLVLPEASQGLDLIRA